MSADDEEDEQPIWNRLLTCVLEQAVAAQLDVTTDKKDATSDEWLTAWTENYRVGQYSHGLEQAG